ncbi:hypothetical protein K439DRAFT_1638985 [Ramaria rubella]|nr:hypothetical protein K439DRAFT_1638985 [Ramaria rubella]
MSPVTHIPNRAIRRVLPLQSATRLDKRKYRGGRTSSIFALHRSPLPRRGPLPPPPRRPLFPSAPPIHTRRGFCAPTPFPALASTTHPGTKTPP